MIKPFLYYLLLVIAVGGNAYAQTPPNAGPVNPITDPGVLSGNSQTSIADIAQAAAANAQNANDDAHIVLTELFTPNWDNLFSGQVQAGPSTVLFEIFGYMNAATLVGVSILMFYVLTVGVIGTAHEGEALGKRYSTLWTPIRSVSAIAMLMPLPGAGGISLLQALLLMCISVGSNSANYIWGNVIDYVGDNGGSLVVSMPINYASVTKDLASGILEIEVAQNYVYESAASQNMAVSSDILEPPSANGSFSSVKSGLSSFFSNTFGASLDGSTIEYVFASPIPQLKGKFGKITVRCDAQYMAMCNAQTAALGQLITDLNVIAAPIGQRTYDASQPVDPAAFQNAITAFNTAIFNSAKEVANENNTNFQDNYKAFATTAKQEGWVEAGAWYWSLAGMQERIQKTVDTPPQLQPVSGDDIIAQGFNDINDVLGVLGNYQRKADADIDAAAVAGSDDSGEWGNIMRMINQTMMWIPNEVVTATTKGDPIANLKSFGAGVINTITTLWGVLFVGKVITTGFVAAGKMTPVGTLASKAAGSVVGKVAGEIVKPFATVFMMVALPILGFFIYITYYLPSIPFVMWMTGVVSWLILVMETIVVAPLWAAAHAIPEGEGFAGQHGKQGYMLFMNVLMRPPLMVAGFFISMFLIKGVSWIVGKGLSIYFVSATAGEVVGPIGMIAMVIIGLSIIIKLAHKCFDLITWMPDNALKWIGSGASSLGESNQTGQISGVMMGAMSSVTNALGRNPAGLFRPNFGGSAKQLDADKSADKTIADKATESALGMGDARQSSSSVDQPEPLIGGATRAKNIEVGRGMAEKMAQSNQSVNVIPAVENTGTKAAEISDIQDETDRN